MCSQLNQWGLCVGHPQPVEFSRNTQSWHFCTTSNVNKLKTATS